MPTEISEPNKTFKPLKIDANPIQVKNDCDGFSFDIFSVVQKENVIDFMLVFENNSSQHIRIEIEKISLFVNSKHTHFEGDFKLNDLTMGTNDILLKNTVLRGGNLVRNTLFNNLSIDEFSSNDTIEIKLLINGNLHEIYNSLGESSFNKFEIIS